MRLIRTVKINDPTIMAFHGTKTRTGRSSDVPLSVACDVQSATARVKRAPIEGKQRNAMFRSSVSTTDATRETASHSTATDWHDATVADARCAYPEFPEKGAGAEKRPGR